MPFTIIVAICLLHTVPSQEAGLQDWNAYNVCKQVLGPPAARFGGHHTVHLQAIL